MDSNLNNKICNLRILCGYVYDGMLAKKISAAYNGYSIQARADLIDTTVGFESDISITGKTITLTLNLLP